MCSFIIGNQGENYHTAMETYYFIKELNIGRAWNYKITPFYFFIPIPFPKTQIYEYAKENGLIKND